MDINALCWSHDIADPLGIDLGKMPDLHRSTDTIGGVSDSAAAVTAGLGVGIYDSFDAIDRFVSIEKTFQPHKDTAALYNRMKPVFQHMKNK